MMKENNEIEMKDNKLYSAIEVAKFLRISRSQLSRFVTNKRISVLRVGNRTYFNKPILDEFIKTCLVEAKLNNNEAL